MDNVVFNSEQASSLMDFLQDNVHGTTDETVVITQQGASIYVAADLASVTIDPDGTVDEA
jgi:hypothetical protein